MEFLLVNHPLDCPICDQGGECDLQVSIVRKSYIDQQQLLRQTLFGFFHVHSLITSSGLYQISVARVSGMWNVYWTFFSKLSTQIASSPLFLPASECLVVQLLSVVYYIGCALHRESTTTNKCLLSYRCCNDGQSSQPVQISVMIDKLTLVLDIFQCTEL